MKLLKLFDRRITDEVILKKLGPKFYIRNGIGFGFVSDPFLYDNCYLEVGFGRIYSGYGDWGGGFDHASDSALKMIIDRDFKIIRSLVGYYTGCDPKTYKTAKILHSKLKGHLVIENETLSQIIENIFSKLPVKKHIGLDGSLKDKDHAIRMLNYFLYEQKPTERIKDASSKNAPMGTH